MCNDRTTCQCVLCKAERERAKRPANGHVNTKTRLERDQERRAEAKA